MERLLPLVVWFLDTDPASYFDALFTNAVPHSACTVCTVTMLTVWVFYDNVWGSDWVAGAASSHDGSP